MPCHSEWSVSAMKNPRGERLLFHFMKADKKV